MSNKKKIDISEVTRKKSHAGFEIIRPGKKPVTEGDVDDDKQDEKGKA